MPLHRDFLMRMIEQLSAAFFRILAGKAVEAPEHALVEIEGLVGEALGTSREFALGLGPAAIDSVAPQLAAELGRLLLLHAKLADNLGDHGRAARSRAMGFRAVELALTQPAPAYAELAAEQLREHLGALDDVDSTALAAACLAAHRVYVERRRWSDAEDWLFFAYDLDAAAARAVGHAFFGRLRDLTDEELAASGLTRDEVAESATALEH